MTVKNEILSVLPYLTWTTVGVTWLAGFDPEIKVIARILELQTIVQAVRLHIPPYKSDERNKIHI